MAQDTDRTVVIEELSSHGIRFQERATGSGHTKLIWETGGKENSYTVSKTPSDWRARLNARSQVRRMLKSSGVKLGQKRRTKTEEQMGISQMDSIPDQVRELKSEIYDLTDMMLYLTDMVEAIKLAVTPTQEPEPEPTPVKPPPRSRTVKVVDYLAVDKWLSTQEVADMAMLPKNKTYCKLFYQLKKNKVERKQGHWRLKGV